jgi:hypothetical protein
LPVESGITATPQGIASNDWMLPVPDPEAEEQTIEGEMDLFVALNSYYLLDADNEEAFEKLTEEAREIFGVPTSLISLIDLGGSFSCLGTETECVKRLVMWLSVAILSSIKRELWWLETRTTMIDSSKIPW